MRTAGNAVIIYDVINSFDFEFVFQRNIHFFKGCFLQQIFVNPDGIESGISQKRFGIDKRMLLKEILQSRDQRFGIRKALVLIRGIRFLSNNDLRMGFEKIFVVKGNMPDDAQSVCNDAEFKSIAEMSIDVHLLDCGVGGGMPSHILKCFLIPVQIHTLPPSHRSPCIFSADNLQGTCLLLIL